MSAASVDMRSGDGPSSASPRAGRERARGGTALVRRLTLAALRRFSTTRALGSLWWIVDPLVMVGVYAVVMGGVLGLVERWGIASYPLFLACALIPWRWQLVSTARGANALLANAALLAATPVRRDAVLRAEVWASTVEALYGVPVLLGFMVWYELPVTWQLAWLPLPFAVLGVLIFGTSYLLSVLTVLFRDTGNAYQAILRVLWFLSPGLYGVQHFPDEWRSLWIWANPFVGILEGIRRPIHDGLPPLWEPLAASAVWAVAIWLVGRAVFRTLENEAVRQLG